MTRREQALEVGEAALATRVEASEGSEALLREANEHLVVATLGAQAMTERAEQATAQMSYMARHDILTDLPNRALLKDRLVQLIALSRRHGRRLGLLYVDLDHFKHINDSLGHQVGDEVLQAVARRLSASVRSSDTVSRQGGDEFVVLLAEVAGVEEATQAAEKLLGTMEEPILIGGHRLHVTLSIGISVFPDDADDAESVLRNADTALYQAKRGGRASYQVFTPEMNDRAVARQAVQQALHRGLEQQGFVLHYQPKVDLETGAITGAEALVRLRQAGQPLLAPSEFVGIAEDCGLIQPIGRWVLGEACRQATTWLAAGLGLWQVAVNVSAVEFHGKDFLAGVRSTLQETGMDPRRLELEITESGLLAETRGTSRALHALKDLGVQIAIDDFGTGYSSLSYLRRFPIDTLKIDRSFLQDLGGEAGAAIVSAVISIGLRLKQRVVAEGIETPTQLEFLRRHGCAEGQGFYFSRPLPAPAFAELLRAPHGAWS